MVFKISVMFFFIIPVATKITGTISARFSFQDIFTSFLRSWDLAIFLVSALLRPKIAGYWYLNSQCLLFFFVPISNVCMIFVKLWYWRFCRCARGLLYIPSSAVLCPAVLTWVFYILIGDASYFLFYIPRGDASYFLFLPWRTYTGPIDSVLPFS